MFYFSSFHTWWEFFVFCFSCENQYSIKQNKHQRSLKYLDWTTNKIKKKRKIWGEENVERDILFCFHSKSFNLTEFFMQKSVSNKQFCYPIQIMVKDFLFLFDCLLYCDGITSLLPTPTFLEYSAENKLLIVIWWIIWGGFPYFNH